MRVVGYHRTGSSSVADARSDFDALTDGIEEALSQADFVVLLIPAAPENAHFINAERLAMMPPRAWLINTARGMVVDERALYDALAAGRLRGAALRQERAVSATGKEMLGNLEEAHAQGRQGELQGL